MHSLLCLLSPIKQLCFLGHVESGIFEVHNYSELQKWHEETPFNNV